MSSINFNASANSALRTLQQTNTQLSTTQSRISTGLAIGEAKDNAAYWSISTTLKSDNKSMATVSDALGLGSATVDTAYQGLNAAKDVLDEIKSKLTAATQDGVNKDTIQKEIGELQKQLKSIAGSSVFSGENWLSVDTSSSSYSAQKNIVASFARTASGSVSIGTIGVDISTVALFDNSNVAGAGGILNKSTSLKGSDGRDMLIGGTSVDVAGNTSKGGLRDATVVGGTTSGGVTTTPSVNDGAAAIASSEAVGNASDGELDFGVLDTTVLTAIRAAGQNVTLKLTVNNAAQEVTVRTADIAGNTAANFAAAVDAALTAKGIAVDAKTDLGVGAGTTKFVLDLQGVTSGDKLKLNDIVITDSAGRAVKPSAVLVPGTAASFTASTVGSYQTQATLVWTDITNKTAQVNLKIDGVDMSFDVGTGTSAADLVNNLNNNSNFASVARAAGTTDLTITSATTGANSKVSVNSIVFKNADGTVFVPTTGTKFEKVGQAAKTTTVAFSPMTLDANDSVKFDIQVNKETAAKTVTIDKALIDKTLGASANGQVSLIADYKKVLDAALSQAGITELKTTAGATTVDIETTTFGGPNASIKISNTVASTGGAQISVDKIDVSSATMNKLGATDATKVRQVLNAYIDVVNSAITKVTEAASNLGSVSARIDLQKTFVQNLMDTIDKGVSGLVDADMNEESTKLQALQVKQQLGVQALSIANQSAQSVLSLFRG